MVCVPVQVIDHLLNEMIVFDAVYTPSETTLLGNARSAGCRIITGEELFKCQAQLQSQLFLNTLV